MRNLILIAILLLSAPILAQEDYYEPQPLSRKEARKAMKAKELQHCYCPYQKSTSVWHDVWNEGIVGSLKAVYQSTVKPQAIGAAVGAVQSTASEAPVPSAVSAVAVSMAISQTQKARRHQRNRQVRAAGRACDCDPCPYHQRYKPNAGIK